MKDKPALAVFIIVLSVCLIAALCLGVSLFVFPYSFSRSATPPLPTSSPIPRLSPTESRPHPNPIPALSITVSPNKLMKGSKATIHIEVNNPGKMDLQGHTVNVGYAAENDLSTYLIQSIPMTSGKGEFFEQDITWDVDYIPDDRKYETRLTLLKPDSTTLTETSTPIEFVVPSLIVSLDPAQLTPTSAATIHIQVNNPSGADIQGYKLIVGYSAKGASILTPISEIDLSLVAGETFEQDIQWDLRSTPPSGDCELQVLLLLPNQTLLTETRVAFVLNEK